MRVWFEGDNLMYDNPLNKLIDPAFINVGGEIRRIQQDGDDVFIEAVHKNMVAVNLSTPDKCAVIHEDSHKMSPLLKKKLQLFLKGETDLNAERVNNLTWETFKEQMEYFVGLSKQEHLTDEVKEEINTAMKNLVREWTNPRYIVKVDE